MRRGLAVAALLVSPLAGSAAQRTHAAAAPKGGTFRVATVGIDTIDPALTYGPAVPYLNASCARLMRPNGPEVSERAPTVSRDGRTYTFHLRKSFRFNTGTRVTAASFAHALERTLYPAMQSAGAPRYFTDIVGADEISAGKATHARGIRAHGYTLTIRLTHRVPDFTARLTTPSACAVPTGLPAEPEAVSAPLSGAGPYYIAEYLPGRRLVLRRNRFYRGSRPHRVDRVVSTIVDGDRTAVDAVVRGRADWADIGEPSIVTTLSAAQRRRIHVLRAPALGVRYLDMNTSRPLFRNNAPLRRAINFALDRPALVAARGGTLIGAPADHYLPPGMPGFRRVRVYPLRHPDLRTARALARGHLRRKKAVLYGQISGATVAEADIVRRDLRRIGVDVEIRRFPGEQLFTRLFTPGEPYDLALTGIFADYADPYDFLNPLLEGRLIRVQNSLNLARFDVRRYNRLLAHAAQLTGRARYGTYGKLDVDIARNEAPYAAYMNVNDVTVVARRVGCVVQHRVDLAAVCLRR